MIWQVEVECEGQCKVPFVSSGKLNVKDKELEDMLKEATGPINFTMFLSLFGEKLHGEKLKE